MIITVKDFNNDRYHTIDTKQILDCVTDDNHNHYIFSIVMNTGEYFQSDDARLINHLTHNDPIWDFLLKDLPKMLCN